jgi:hypothetical protein
MNEPSNNELRRIRQLLAAILACLILIVLALSPGVIPLALAALIAYGLLMVLLSVSQTARHAAAQLWFQFCSLWRH